MGADADGLKHKENLEGALAIFGIESADGPLTAVPTPSQFSRKKPSPLRMVESTARATERPKAKTENNRMKALGSLAL